MRGAAPCPWTDPPLRGPSRLAILAHLANSAVGAVYLSLVVERAKKCLDFTATLYLLHFCFCLAYRGFPTSLDWWVLNFAGLVTMAVLGRGAPLPFPPHPRAPASAARRRRAWARLCSAARWAQRARTSGFGAGIRSLRRRPAAPRREWLCLRRELREIPLVSGLGGGRDRDKGASSGAMRSGGLGRVGSAVMNGGL